MNPKGQFSESFLKKLEDMGMFQRNNFGDNFHGLGKMVDMSQETKNAMSANEPSEMIEFLKRKGMMSGSSNGY